MRYAVTGASGALGKALMAMLPTAIRVDRHMIDEPVDVLIHAACPNWRDPYAVEDFSRFNLSVLQYVRHHDPIVVNVGSWWQYAEGTCRALGYTRLKDYQATLFPQARTVVAYSIFGPDKGYGLDVVRHITGEWRLLSLGTAWRDFIHVDDVADAVIRAAHLEPGTYAACTGQPLQVNAVARAFGIHLPVVEVEPSAELRYPLVNIARPSHALSDFIAQRLAANADRVWREQTRRWEAA